MALAAYTLIPHFMIISVRYLCHYEDALKKGMEEILPCLKGFE